MISDMQNVEHLSRVISQATAPAFLLGAVAAFASILSVRMDKITDRSRALNAISDDDPARARLKADIPRLVRRAVLIRRAIFLAVCSAIASSGLLLFAFASAFFQIAHEPGLALLFSVALLLLIGSLVSFAMELRISLNALDHHA
ncbi:DUF2721 domain-containing protein [Methylocella silvestris]|uniref:DUF2721 domain-containing protein n=1 Tax=Methylocella silvestris TaxID=199596 RepID=A0A2J7TLQ7_METSI|nr:DUF2721 domain-containing protein [Methylocella silvestris]PNG27705.1 hypothetical protein CR492_01995 [Methylocella silvestris]